jgi:translation initiation factor IF-1
MPEKEKDNNSNDTYKEKNNKSNKNEKILLEGIVTEMFKGATFKVKLIESKKEVLCHLSGKMRIHKIKLVPGDKVVVEMTPYDLNKGRIVYRI